jgi:hypothetical protein
MVRTMACSASDERAMLAAQACTFAWSPSRAQDVAGGGADGRAILSHLVVQFARQRAAFVFLRASGAASARGSAPAGRPPGAPPDGKAGQRQRQQQQTQGQLVELPVFLPQQRARQPLDRSSRRRAGKRPAPAGMPAARRPGRPRVLAWALN